MIIFGVRAASSATNSIYRLDQNLVFYLFILGGEEARDIGPISSMVKNENCMHIYIFNLKLISSNVL